MIATGTDIKPLECLLFMRNVNSRIYFEQMKGRGTRTINPHDLKSVTPDVDYKTHFMIVDAIGVCETDKTDSKPLERKKTVSFERLMHDIALGVHDDDTLSSLAGRLARLDRVIKDEDRMGIEKTTGGLSLKALINNLLDAIDTDKHIEKAKEIFSTKEPDKQQVQKAKQELVSVAARPFDNPKVRDLLVEIKKSHEQIIDTVSADKVIFAGFDEAAKEKAMGIIESFKQFIEKNRDEITALQIIYSQPYSKRRLTYETLKELAKAMEQNPYRFTTEQIWLAYEQLEKAIVRGYGAQRILTNIISLVRFTLGKAVILEPFADTVDERFHNWMEKYRENGREFTEEQMLWLTMIKDHIATSLNINIDDFAYAPFHEKGGAIKAQKVFGESFKRILEELNEELVA